ncbi:hypothetical protein [Bosea thiooxidans]|uniref:hypothetical protein n=1 Tax=Bosea thiooxidans TaxID=53254 RepID=UPI0011161400|nr:hypothetical protein [Bosea thiooxidans]
MQKIMNSAILGNTALQFLNIYALAWSRGLGQEFDEYDPLSLNQFVYEIEYVRAEGSVPAILSGFQQHTNGIGSWAKRHSRSSGEHIHFCLGYLSRDDEGTRCMHGLAIVVPEAIGSWDFAFSDGHYAAQGLSVRRHQPQSDRWSIWKRLTYGVALSAMFGGGHRPCFTASGPMVEGSALHFRDLSRLYAELRSPDTHHAFSG